MASQDIPGPDLRVCANCRSFSCSSSRESRCAGRDGQDPVAPAGSCLDFQISFAAAKQLAVRNRAVMDVSQPDEPWAENMRRHLSAGAGQRPLHS